MAKSRSGGGITGKNVTQRPVRTGQRARAINERGVSQIGSNMGNHVTDRRQIVNPVERTRGELRPSRTPGSIPLGNEVAGNVGKGGCGTGRVLYGQCGSQQQYGSAAPGSAPAKNTDILRQFGPDVPGRR
jgi:hypothetical protein